MPIFQEPAVTLADIERGKPLDIPPEEVGAMDEATWYARAYRGGLPQLTLRAVAMGSILGFLLAFTNLYVGLKAGWGLGVALTACITSFTAWSALVRAGIAKGPMSILETNCVQSTASSAGYSTGSTLVSAIPAMLLLSVTDATPRGTQLPWYVLAPWVFSVGALGVVMGIPMKRRMINQERLTFPSGTAAAVLLQSLYSHGAEAIAKGRALLAGGLTGAVIPVLTSLNVIVGHDASGHVERRSILPAQSAIFDWLPRISATVRDPRTHVASSEPFPLSSWNVVLDHSGVLIAAGAIVGLRTTLSMLAGGLVVIIAIGPEASRWEWVNPAGQVVSALTRPGAAWKEIGLWFGAPLMVAYGLSAFAFQYGTIARSIAGATASQAPRQPPEAADVEVPWRWFVMGMIVSGAAVVGIAAAAFGVPVYLGVLAVALTFFLALVACRATGETDITPIGAMGKITQLTYGALMPQNYAANLMTASITASASAEAADLLNDLKSGYLLGAHPRRQFVAQFLGIFAGTVASVVGYYLLVPDATALTGTAGAPPQFAAPAAAQWKAVAELFRTGIGNLHPMAREGIAVGLALGLVLAAAERVLPRARRWLPSASGLGLGLLLPFSTSLSFVLGALAAWVYHRVDPRAADRRVIPISSGLIAGESILGVAVAALNNFVLRG
ncbi:MAG: OPT/YSL family transporter [Polyangiaceae bacterium]|nr:OPT/YSL family transporter [Polyangiaceae bacterium]